MATPTFDWNKLRPLNGDVREGFEELCCQLASQVEAPDNARFIRVGKPDGGIECYWKLLSGEEWGWQAKYFRDSPSPSQWTQIKDSFKRSLDTHPALSQYTVCLPQDLPDARRDGTKTAFQKWEELIHELEELAKEKDRVINVVLWNESEIATRLSTDQNRGRFWFWFEAEQFSLEWFQQRVDDSISLARDRYLPNLHVELPLESSFHAFGRTEEFFRDVGELYAKLKKELRYLRRPKENPESTVDRAVHEASSTLLELMKYWISRDQDNLEYNLAGSRIPWEDIRSASADLYNKLREEEELASRMEENKSGTKEGESENQSWRRYKDYLARALNETRYVLDFCDTNEARIANRPLLILLGSAGQGKTHLVCQMVSEDVAHGRQRLLFFGQQFDRGDVWTTLIRKLGLDCSRPQFLGALSASAQAAGEKLWFAIDALNEVQDMRFWQTELPPMVEQLKPYPWLGLCVTCRSDVGDVIPFEHLNEKDYVVVQHDGFQGELTWEAMDKYFSHYGIEPSTPPVFPEFQNPLFLQLLCKSLHDLGKRRIPEGMHGITTVIELLLKAANRNVSVRRNCDQRDEVVHKSVRGLAAKMLEANSDYVEFGSAKELLRNLNRNCSVEFDLLRELESEALIDVSQWNREDSNQRKVRFTYQRICDHMIIRSWLDNHQRELTKPRSAFRALMITVRSWFEKQSQEQKQLRAALRVFMDNWNSKYHVGQLFRALAVQLPERYPGVELPSLLSSDDPALAMAYRAFIESLPWRSRESISATTADVLNQAIGFYEYEVLEAMLLLATVKDHPLNAHRLHKYLLKFDMPERESFWTPFLHNERFSDSQATRLIHWALVNGADTSYDDETILLASITLSWFLSTSVRTIRDRSTKALVRLLEGKQEILLDLLQRFEDVEEPYIQERLYAVAYGCVLRQYRSEQLENIARYTYEHIFVKGEPPFHLLLRDYARGIIEYAIHCGLSLQCDLTLVRPPYSSEWPAMKIPTDEELKEWGAWQKEAPKKEYGKTLIYNSVIGGLTPDFGKYVVGDLNHWSSERLDEPHIPTLNERYDNFVDSLSGELKDAWDLWQEAKSNLPLKIILKLKLPTEEKTNHDLGASESDTDTVELEKNIEVQKKNFEEMLTADKALYAEYREVVDSEGNPAYYSIDENAFDADMAKRWIVERVRQYGWRTDYHGRYDSDVKGYDRHDVKTERIGKKYQWIAYYELLARLSDNFRLRKYYGDDEDDPIYNGPWNVYVTRDIDASNLLERVYSNPYENHIPTWWFSEIYEDWRRIADDKDWVSEEGDLPNPLDLIQAADEWLPLYGYFNWTEPLPIGEEIGEYPRRNILYFIHAYLVRKSDSSALKKWLETEKWHGHLPTEHKSYEMLLGEYCWAPIFNDRVLNVDKGGEGWIKGRDSTIPCEVMLAHFEYFRESPGPDYSYEEGHTIHLPCPFIVRGMNLNRSAEEGKYIGSNGEEVAFDPSVFEPGPGMPLIKREALLNFLEEQGLDIVWTLYGEKRLLSYSQESGSALNLYGSYALVDGKVVGKLRTRLEEWDRS